MINNLTSLAHVQQLACCSCSCTTSDCFRCLPGLGEYQVPGVSIIRCKNLALYIRDGEYLCLSDEPLKAVGPFYLVSMPGPGEVKDPTQSGLRGYINV